MDYQEFLNNKTFVLESKGFDVEKEDLNPMLFSFQLDIVRWALAKGRAAVFTDCGTGKSAIQLEWANKIHELSGGDVLIVAPLAVVEQTRREGIKFGINVTVCASQEDVQRGINITNYEKLDHFIANRFQGVVLDESSILKSYSGKMRNQIINAFMETPYKLACTATPAPNDYMELGNHSEFIGVMTRAEMLAMFFCHDGGDTSKWRLKGHARDLYWQWMASWAVFMDNPRTLGYDIEGYDLPPLNVEQIIVDGDAPIYQTMSLMERREARRESMPERCQAAADLVNGSEEQWIVWCDLNAESNLLHKLIPDSVEIQGSDSPEKKASAVIDFTNGDTRCIVSKSSIFGFGVNWQQCHNVIFVGLSDSYEQYYQAVRRCWRFGQDKTVNVYIIISKNEGAVLENINRKEVDSRQMINEMVKYTKDITKKELKRTSRLSAPYNPKKEMVLPQWEEFNHECA